MLGSKIKALFTKQTAPKNDKDPWDQKYEALAKAYKKAGYTKKLPQLGDVKYLAACRKLGLDPVFAVPPPGYNPDLCFVKHQPPLHLPREVIFAQPKPASYYDSLRSSRSSASSGSSSTGSKRVRFMDEMPAAGPKMSDGLARPLKSAMKKRPS